MLPCRGVPQWHEVRDRITTDLLYEGRKAAEDQFYAEVLPRYQIVYDEGIRTVLDELDDPVSNERGE